MTPADRVALILGRAIIRAETLQAELEEARERIAVETELRVRAEEREAERKLSE